ncbi:MAG: MFS transporter [Actinomycetota bacterium]
MGTVLAALFAVRESRDETVGHEVDYAGVVVLTAGLTALVLALVEGNSWGWGSPQVVSLIAGSVVLLVAFVAVELRVRAPMVEFSLFANRNFIGAVSVAFIVTFAMLGMFFFLAMYMQNILGYSPLEAGVRFLPTTLVIMAVAPISGRLSDRIGPRWPITVGLSLTALSLYMFTQITAGTTYTDLLPAFMLMGTGVALTMSPMSTAAMNAVPVAKAGIASGVLSMFRMIGGTFGVAAIGALFQADARSRVDDLLSNSSFSAAQRSDIAHGIVSGQPAGAVHLNHTQATQLTHDIFIYALSHAMRLSTAVAVLGVIIGFTLIRSRKAHPAPQAEPAAAAGTPAAEVAAIQADG